MVCYEIISEAYRKQSEESKAIQKPKVKQVTGPSTYMQDIRRGSRFPVFGRLEEHGGDATKQANVEFLGCHRNWYVESMHAIAYKMFRYKA